jgi:hypothetical protein
MGRGMHPLNAPLNTRFRFRGWEGGEGRPLPTAPSPKGKGKKVARRHASFECAAESGDTLQLLGLGDRRRGKLHPKAWPNKKETRVAWILTEP